MASIFGFDQDEAISSSEDEDEDEDYNNSTEDMAFSNFLNSCIDGGEDETHMPIHAVMAINTY